MRINTTQNYSLVNGPGRRFVVWFQGCSIHCNGCINKHMWSKTGGKSISVKKLVSMIPKDVDGVTISGGEPLDQYLELLKLLKVLHPKYEIFLTSGYRLEDIVIRFPKVLEYIDILIDGPFDKTKLETSPTSWRGSTNQNVCLLSDRAQKYKKSKSAYSAEVIVSPNGDMSITGFSVPKYLLSGKLK